METTQTNYRLICDNLFVHIENDRIVASLRNDCLMDKLGNLLIKEGEINPMFFNLDYFCINVISNNMIYTFNAVATINDIPYIVFKLR